MSQEREGKLVLVGAGPGDPDLITVKGMKALALADVVLYDALAHPQLLDYAPVSSEKIFVGKRKGVCQTPQNKINELIVSYSLQGKVVVRLKGGDPYIFGRGHEEVEYAASFGIDSEIIPGLSSTTSLATMQGVPLTRRGISESFFVITATTRSHDLSDDILGAAKTTATVVVLMGMSKLTEIVALFKQEGKKELPIGIIQEGSTINEKVGLGTIETIEAIVEEQKLSSPAVIIIGEVVRLHPEYLSAIATTYSIQG